MVSISAATQIGKKSGKENNQDDYAIWNEEGVISRKEVMKKEVELSNPFFFGVADGVSCIRKPEESSKIVIDTCINATKKSQKMSFIMDEVNAALSTKNKKFDPYYASTVTLGLIQDNILYVSNIGDSPLFLHDGNTIQQISQEQTLANLKKKQEFDEEEIFEKDYHTLLHYVGEKEKGSTICANAQIALNPGNVLFLSSDGIDIEKAIQYYKEHKDCIAKDIIDDQNTECDDNLTLILVKIQ